MEENEEKEKKQSQENSSQMTKEAVQKIAQKGAKKFAGKASLMGPLAHIVAVAAPILVIVIILGGIILFFLTMPGMVMEKLKALGKAIAKGMASWFGADNTEMIDDYVIYETLDYLEEMGYDLKGYGFLTDYVGTEEDGVERSNGEDKVNDKTIPEGNIINAESEFVLTYLVSDNYVYTLKNKNLVTGSGFLAKLNAVGQHIKDFFGGSYGTKWTRGLIALYEEDGGIGKRGGFYSDTGFANFDKVEIDTEAKTLVLKKGQWFNSNGSMKYSLDGWTGRYGMPLEFLLSVHVATMMPDLAYDMATSFETEINMLLHSVTGADVTAGFKTGESKYAEYGDLHDIWGMGVLNTKEKAMKIMKEYNISSPDNCTGAHKAGYGTKDIDGTSSNYQSNEYAIEAYNEMMAQIKELGYTGDLPNNISNYSDVDSMLEDQTTTWNTEFRDQYESVYMCEDKQITWIGKNPDTGEDCTYSITVTITHGKLRQDQGGYEFLDFECSKVNRDFSQSEWDVEIENAKKKKEEAGEDTSQMTNSEILGTQKCSTTTDEFTEACSNCTNYISRIMSELSTANDGSFAYYVPYIENVTDHWYRDVYFTNVRYDSDGNATENALEFVDYDYDYEAVMKERWTDYETYEDGDRKGDFKLYAVNQSGGYARLESEIKNYDVNKFTKDGSYYLFNGTQEEAKALDIAVMKKAKTVKSSDTEILEDLGWSNDNSTKIWTAYEDDGELATDWEPTYPDDEDEIKKNIYHKIKSNSNVVQVGEGQRTETNAKIKKMFLNNKYLKYDGTAERAEQITKLRKEKMEKVDDDRLYYGPLREKDLKNEEISKYASKVALNQDSLNAFSMLENTHTLDADYIYRDFKELVVELGYFTKEELTDETPRLLQWLVPDIGSGGYPNRAIDKNENEFGTMVHSKGDIDANKKNTLTEIVKQMKEDEPTKGNAPEPDNPQNLSSVSAVQSSSNILSSNDSNINLSNIKGAGASFVLERVDEAGEGYKTVVQSGNVKYLHRYQGNQPYSKTEFYWGGESSTSTLGEAACGLFSCYNVLTGYGYEFDPVKDLAGVKWPATMDAVKNLMEEKGVTGQFIDYSDTAALDQALNEGRPAILLFAGDAVDKQGICWTTCGHFVALVGKDREGNILTLDSAAGDEIKRHNYPGTVEDMLPAFQQKSIWIADEPPTGMKKGKESPYEGYQGNEAVVSPVTGILLDYGTYDDDDKSSITGEKYRQNVDLKYAKEIKDDKNGTEPNKNEPSINPEYDSEKPDKVGYAKILVLDAESYKKLEANTETPWKDESLVSMDTKTDENGDKVSKVKFVESTATNAILDKEERLKDRNDDGDDGDPWTDIEKTVYGYKEFAERYEMSGLSGYIVYIDGFKCERPDEEFTEEQLETEIPSGDEIKLSDFQKITPEKLKNPDSIDEKDIMPTFYEKDEIHKMASQKATEKAQAEAEVRNQAWSTLYLENQKLTFIKEGTLLGRTRTDFELIEGKNYRNESGGYEKYRKKNSTTTTVDPNTTLSNEPGKDKDKNKEENENPVIGNYLRIILRDTDDTVVENVEDYMKLDDGEVKSQELDDEKFLFWMGCYCENGTLEQRGDKWVSKATITSGDSGGATHFFGLAKSGAHWNTAQKLGYTDVTEANWAEDKDFEMVVDIYLTLIEEQKAEIKEKLQDENMPDGYLQAFISILHNYGNLTNRGDEYRANKKVSEVTWTTYNGDFAEALRRRRVAEWKLITEGLYMNYNDGNTGEIDWKYPYGSGTQYSEETPFTDFCKDHGLTNIEIKKPKE